MPHRESRHPLESLCPSLSLTLMVIAVTPLSHPRLKASGPRVVVERIRLCVVGSSPCISPKKSPSAVLESMVMKQSRVVLRVWMRLTMERHLDRLNGPVS